MMEKIDWSDHVRNEVLQRVKDQGGKEYPTYSKKEEGLNGLVTCCVGTGFYEKNTLLKER
jgi:hypothetical protein